MRVVGGKFRGRPLEGPKNDRVRPTSDRVRESIFNVMAHNDFGVGFTLEGARVLDLFAGTGALGVEALSRGAKFCLFVDDHFESRAIIRRNVEAMNLTGVSKIWRRDATDLGPIEPNAGGQFGLVFADPPYKTDLIVPALQSAIVGGWLAKNAIVVAEMADDETLSETASLIVIQERIYGDTKVVFLSGPS
jgi:16S rRNA (guanine966-N2)-methyltransferase